LWFVHFPAIGPGGILASSVPIISVRQIRNSNLEIRDKHQKIQMDKKTETRAALPQSGN